MTNRSALEQAIAKAGGQSQLASGLGVAQSLVSYWLNSARKGVSAQYAPAIERITGISRHDLRPDVFGPKPSEERGAAA